MDAANPSGTSDARAASDTRADTMAPSEQPLLDHSSWGRYDPATDPLKSHQPAQLVCGIAGFFVEQNHLEIDTTRCNYVLAEHPSLLDVPAGTEVHMQLSHYDLAAPEPAEVHAAILFGDELQWETHIPIPATADVLNVTWQATRPLGKGEPIRVHLHNHGQNTYQLVSLTALVE
jgi:hypothetical protein